MSQPSFGRYERARFCAVLVVHALTVAALWGQWRRLLVFVAFAVGAVACNAALYAVARRTRRFERIDDVKNSFNAIVGFAVGHFCGWPLPQWLFLTLNALGFSANRPSSRWKLAGFVLATGALALVDGVPWVIVASFVALTASVYRIAELRDAMFAQRTAELDAAMQALAEAQAIALVGSFTFAAGKLTWSDQLLQIFGFEATPTTEQFLERVHVDDRESVRQAMLAMSDGSPFSHEYRAVRPDGEVRWIYSRGQGVVDDGGKLVGLRGIAQDVTDKKKLHARLLLTDRLTSLGTLAGGIAHEINNPLSYVITNLDYISEELRLAPGSARRDGLDEVVDEARQGAERVRRVVRDLRAFARDDAREDDEARSADVSEVLAFATKMAANEIRYRARLVNDCPPLPRVAASDSRLGQVLLNLLVNAAQAIPEGNVEGNCIRISGGVDEKRRVVRVSIGDSGCGIPATTQATIFDPFFTTKPVGSGMGLGLSICHSIVGDFGGEISVESEVGRGSTFTVTVPLAECEDDDDEATHVQRRPAPRRGRVLIVDDDPLVATSLRRVLADHEVELLHSGRAAVARLAADEFDVVLCDLLMPDLTGMDVYDQVLAAAPAVGERMVFMTGGAFTARAREFLERVPNARFDKPVDHRWLRTFVAERVQQRSAAAA